MIEIRKASTGDIEELVRMRMAYLQADYGEISEAEKEQVESMLPNYFCGHLNRDLFAYVACDGEHIAATVFLYISEKPANPHNLMGKMGEVLNVYTEPDYRRQGLSEQLIRKMLSDAGEWNLSAVILQSTDMGKALYKKVGFQEKISKYTAMRYEF